MRFANQSIREGALLSAGILLCALSGQASAQWSGTVALTSDYVWRGSSQTREEPALQGGLRYTHGSGFYASVWGSNVKFAPDNGARSEFDLAAGWSGKVAEDWAVDLYLLRYQYPSAHTRLNWNELNASATWRDNYWLAVGHSDNAMASRSRGTYLQLGARVPISEQWRVEASVARYVLESRYADSYTHGAVGVVWAFKAPFEARLTLHGTDSAARRLFTGMAGSRAELALQASF
ncbi:TorF family putative porin [Comamonas endophytica]|uniref:TorF family putative porin n=2 Tax=Comamonas endophytica TaxID=2949090 RepID=A0ABY6GD32_9BURK|nr:MULTISPECIES: TorF family putative porin [unclassified Acidovorax]MCD2513727.1 TorF family putative porin [Acidovorax sp. D4N7]UYG52267.1 TorF family putative porin [Acidovorax sp. 5MLIR]